MTSRTNRHSGGQNPGGTGEVAPLDFEKRRQLAVKRYLDGDPIEVICQEMGCSKSWLYKWKNRYQAAEPTWSQERSRRPKTTPARTPEAIEAAISDLRRTLAPEGSEPASARGIRAPLCQHPSASLPSLRTISRLLNRQSQEGPFSSSTIDARTALLAPPHLER
jgi:transposase-like protein